MISGDGPLAVGMVVGMSAPQPMVDVGGALQRVLDVAADVRVADMAMEVFSAGTTDLDQLVMFVVDATKPFSAPAKLE